MDWAGLEVWVELYLYRGQNQPMSSLTSKAEKISSAKMNSL